MIVRLFRINNICIDMTTSKKYRYKFFKSANIGKKWQSKAKDKSSIIKHSFGNSSVLLFITKICLSYYNHQTNRRILIFPEMRTLRREFSHQILSTSNTRELSPHLKCQEFINRFNKIKDNTIQSYHQRSINIKELKTSVVNDQSTPSKIAEPLQTFQDNAQFQSDKYTILNIQKNEEFKKSISRRFSKRKSLDCSKFQITQVLSEETICEKQNLQSYQLKGSKKRLQKKYSFQSLINSKDTKQTVQRLKKSIFHKRQSKQYYPQVLFYYDFLKAQSLIEEVDIQQIESYQGQPISFSIGKGNNNQIIKQAFKRRWWWVEFNNDKKQSLNFLWTQVKDKAFHLKNQEAKDNNNNNPHLVQFSIPNNQQPQAQIKCLHNHFSSNKYFGSKLGMYSTLKNYCKLANQSVEKIIHPIFFVQKFMDSQWKAFTTKYFQSLQINKITICDINLNKKYWLVKQNNKNFISNKIYSTYKEIKKHVQKQSKKGATFIIQQYISKPFLYKKRKFDVKCYVLVNRLKQKINFYVHKEGIISLACQKFDIMDLNNQFSHFITDSVQTKHRNFGQYEPGNKIDFETFQQYLNNLHGSKYDFLGKAVPEMRQTISRILTANYHILNKEKTSCFELIQCVFILDQDFKPWIIDVHTNPRLQTYCPTLQKVIKMVVEDTFKHTVDILFPPPLQWLQSKHNYLSNLSKPSGFVLLQAKQNHRNICDTQIENFPKIKSNDKIYQDDFIDDTQCSQSQSRAQFLLNQQLRNQQ